MEARIALLVLSDTRTIETDATGPAVRAALERLGFSQIERRVLPDDADRLFEALIEHADKQDLILTLGSTGFYERDIAPEATARAVTKRADNLSELIRLRGLEKTPFAHLSRGIAGVRGQCLIVNLPGSPKGATESLEAIAHLIDPILSALRGEDCSAHN